MENARYRWIARWVLVSLAVAAAMVAEAYLQIGGRSVATAACLAALGVWAAGLVWFGPRMQRPNPGSKDATHA